MDERRITALSHGLRRDVWTLSETIGERNTRAYRGLRGAADFIAGALQETGLRVARQKYRAHGRLVWNLEGRSPEEPASVPLVIIGAHYDTARGSPGANDNGSGVATLLALARLFGGHPCRDRIRFVAFVNEERPYLRTSGMGSLLYARHCRHERVPIRVMLSLETLGYYNTTAERRPTAWPSRLIGDDFVAFVANRRSGRLARRARGLFLRHSHVPVRSVALPGWLPGVKSSDHWSFWKYGYRAFMVTDTAPLRDPFYHSPHDTAGRLNYEVLAHVAAGLRGVVGGLL